MAEATALRLDTADTAIECGWEVHSTRSTDEFVRDRVTISVQYSEGDEISRMVRSRPNSEDEFVGSAVRGKPELLRTWLTGRTKVTLGQQLAARRAEGNALLSDPVLRASGRLVAVTLSGSGRAAQRKVDGSRFWANVDPTGIWGLCYAVKGATPGSNPDLGTLWGMQNSYTKAAQEVAEKSATLLNVDSKLKPDSVFCCPAYIVVNEERKVDALVGLLQRAYRAWLAGTDPVVG